MSRHRRERHGESPTGPRALCWPRATVCGVGGTGLSRPQKWGFGVVGFGLLALLPLYTPGFLDTPGISFGGTMAQFVMVAIIAIGLNVVVGQAGLLDLGYVGFYAVGAYTVALLTSPDSPWNQMGAGGFFSSGLGLAGVRAARDGGHRARGPDPRHARRCDCAATTWPSSHSGSARSSGCSPTTSSDITNGSPRPEPDRLSAAGGDASSLPDGVFSSGQLGRRRELRHVVVLAGLDPDDRASCCWSATWSAAGSAGPGWPSARTRTPPRSWASTPSGSSSGRSSSAPAIGGLSGALYAGQVQYVAPTNFNIINSMLFLCAVVLGGQGNKLGVIFGAFIIVYLPNRLLGVRVPRRQPR